MSLVICEIDLNLNNCLHGKFNLFYMSQCMHVPFITGVHLLSLHLKHFKKLLWNAFLVNNQMTCISVVNTFYHRELFFILCILVCHSLIDFAVFYVGFIIFGYIAFLPHVVYSSLMYFHILSCGFLVKRLEVFRKALYKCCLLLLLLLLLLFLLWFN